MIEARKKSFGKVADLYDAVRPDYPVELTSYIISKIPEHANIVEIGCGTGKATQAFSGKGFSITALDISKEMIAHAKTYTRDVTFVVSSFEDANLPKNSFDLVFAAQAFHFIDPKIGFKKIYAIMKKEGHVAFFSNFQSKSRLVREIHGLEASFHTFPKDYGTLESIKKGLKPLFANIQVKSFRRDLNYSKQDYMKLLQTYSPISILQGDKKETFFSDVKHVLSRYSDPLTIPYESLLVLAQKGQKRVKNRRI